MDKINDQTSSEVEVVPEHPDITVKDFPCKQLEVLTTLNALCSRDSDALKVLVLKYIRFKFIFCYFTRFFFQTDFLFHLGNASEIGLFPRS